MAIDIEKAKKDFFLVHATEDLDELQDLIIQWNVLEHKYQEDNAEFLRYKRNVVGLYPINSPSDGGAADSSLSPTRIGTNDDDLISTAIIPEIDPTDLIENVYVIDALKEFEHRPHKDGELETGTHTANGSTYTYQVFSRKKRTFLHVFDVDAERNLYLRIRRKIFDVNEDLALACYLFEPARPELEEAMRASVASLSVSDRDYLSDSEYSQRPMSVVRGVPISQAPILTGVSELEGGVTVHEDPTGYHEPKDPLQIHRGKCSWNGMEISYRAFSARGKTRVIASDSESGRRLYFTVNRPQFVEAKDMGIAFQMLGVIRQQTPMFIAAVSDDDLGSLASSPSKTSHAPSSSWNSPPNHPSKYPTKLSINDHLRARSGQGQPAGHSSSTHPWTTSPSRPADDLGETSMSSLSDGLVFQDYQQYGQSGHAQLTPSQRLSKEQKRAHALAQSRLRKQQKKMEKRAATKESLQSSVPGDETQFYACCTCRGSCTCFNGRKGRIDRMLNDVTSVKAPPKRGWRPTVNFSLFETTATTSVHSLDTESITGSVVSMGSRGSRGSRGSILSRATGISRDVGGTRAWSKGRAKVRGSFQYTSLDSSFLHREAMLNRTLKFASSPPVSTVLRWRSPDDTAALEEIDKLFNRPGYQQSSSSSIANDEDFDNGLEDDSIAFLDDQSAALPGKGSTVGSSIADDQSHHGTGSVSGSISGSGRSPVTLSPIKFGSAPRKGKEKEPLVVYGEDKRRAIEARAAKKAGALAKALLGAPPPVRRGPAPFDMSESYDGQDLSTARSEGTARSERRVKPSPGGKGRTNTTKDEDGPPAPWAPLFEPTPPPKESPFRMMKLFTID